MPSRSPLVAPPHGLHAPTVAHVAHVLDGTARALAGNPPLTAPNAPPRDLHRPTLRAIGGMISGLAEPPAARSSNGAADPPVRGLMNPPGMPAETAVPMGLMGRASGGA
jgi:hypothetical protein